MVKGVRAKKGDTNVAPNGYHYEHDGTKWRLKHHLVAEANLGRPLQKGERVYFVDGDRENFEPDNIEVRKTIGGKEARIHYLKAKILEYQEELAELLAN